MAYVLKARVDNPDARSYEFVAQKTMYGGKRIAAGDVVYLFASDHEGGQGLFAQGVVTWAELLPPVPGVARQTPRVSLGIEPTARAVVRLGRPELKPFAAGSSERPEAELHFKLYRQATNKIVGVSDRCAAFLADCCHSAPAEA